MAVVYNTSVVRSGLLVQIDAANRKSYPGSGSQWFDLSGNSMTATLVNGVTYDPNGYMTFDEALSQMVTVPMGAALTSLSSSMTIECWVYFPSSATWTPQGSGLFSRGSVLGCYGLWRGSTNNNVLAYYRGGTSGVSSVSATVSRDSWYHLGATWNGSDVSLYVNGSLIGTSTVALVGNFDSGDFQIGSNARPSGATSGTYFTGRINDCKIYDRALVASEVQQNFDGCKSRYGL